MRFKLIFKQGEHQNVFFPVWLNFIYIIAQFSD